MKIKTCFGLFDIGLYALNAKVSYEEFVKKCKESSKSEKWFFYQHDIWLARCVDFTFVNLQSIGFNQHILEFGNDSCDCSHKCLSKFSESQDIRNRFGLLGFDTHSYSNDNISDEFCVDYRESIFPKYFFHLITIGKK